MKLGYKAIVGVAISALLIWWTLRDVSFPDVWAILRTGNFWLLGAAVLVATAGFLVRAFRWRVLLEPLYPNTSLNSRFGAITIGFMANNLLPARVGEFVRVYALSRMEPVSMSGALGTLVVERVLDGLVLMLFLVLPVLLPGFPPEAAGNQTIRTLIGSSLLALAVVLSVLIVLLLWPAAVVRTTERVVARLPWGSARRAVDALEAFLEALRIVRRPALLTRAVLWSVGFWAFHGVSFYLGMAAFGIHHGFLAALFTEAAVGFGVALPSAPGFFGTFHAAASWALEGVYGVEPARALAFAYGYHLGGFFPVTFIGLWYARRMGLSLRQMGRTESRVERDVEVKHPEAAEILREAHPQDERPPSSRARGHGPPSPKTKPPPGPLELEAPAKVNLFLHVLEREPGGYHDIRTLFQALELADRLQVRVVSGSDDVRLKVAGLDAGPDEDNLVRRAAEAFLEAAGVRSGLELSLEKRIPAGGGLGGGSSDAAATLRALDALFPGAVRRSELERLALGLGSDVPFFLCGSPLALGEGRGERLTPLAPLPPADVILALPDAAVSTAWAYRTLDARRDAGEGGPRAAPAVREVGSWEAALRLAANDFEDVVYQSQPSIAAARDALLATGPRLVLLAGSGSSVFAVYSSAEDGRRALKQLGSVPGVRFVHTRTRTAIPDPVQGAADAPRG